jgi:U3 small nucleolar RNA-associated protein 23
VCNELTPGETNKHRYVLAVQSQPLITKLSTTPGLPVMHYNARGVLVLSPPSTATVRAKNAAEEERRTEGAKLLENVKDGANVVGGGDVPAPEGRRRKVKGPNPLSVKKKKKPEEEGKKRKAEEEEQPEEEGEDAGRRKKKRKRGRGKGAVAAAIAEINAAGGIGFGTEGAEGAGESDSD